MDLASIIGLILGFGLMVFGMLNSSFGAAGIPFFLHLPSALITFGGTIGAVLASYSMKDFISGIKSIGLIFKAPNFDTVGIIKQIIDLSNVARKEGLLALEESANY